MEKKASSSGDRRNAVLFLVFNRPETTLAVFEAIRSARPPRLYIASDGPRPSKANEAEIVLGLRNELISRVDWPCETFTLFRDHNLGCRKAVSGAISWFFDQEEQGIVLEDDCLPSPSFFPFCDELLHKHASDPQIAGITGDFRKLSDRHGRDQYGRVGYPLIWGWASWRRTWKLYDVGLKDWSGDPMSIPALAEKPKATREYLCDVFNAVKSGIIDTWDFQFNYMCLKHGTDFLHPYVNMITNIGFATGATHTSDPADPNAALPRGDVSFPLKGPLSDRAYQHWLDRKIFAQAALHTKAIKRLRRWSRGLKLGS